MTILGIDPGFAIVGWSLVEKNKCISYGAITTSEKEPLLNRLYKIYGELNEIISSVKIDAVSVEKLFFNTNSKTVIDVSQARGVILLTAKMREIPVFEYTPLQVKIALTGYGRADKQQVQRMVQQIFKLEEIPKPDDAADALALAYCHSVNKPL